MENKELAQEIIRWLSGIAIEQAPLLAADTIRWGVVCSIIGLAVSLAFFYISYRLWMAGNKPSRAEDTKTSFYVASVLIYSVATVVFLVHTFNLAEALSAPRLYLMEQLTVHAREGKKL